MKKLKKKKIENIYIPDSAGYKTDQHFNNSLSINTNPLPDKATQIKFRYLNESKTGFEWSEWFLIE
jgi:hypothetical protein